MFLFILGPCPTISHSLNKLYGIYLRRIINNRYWYIFDAKLIISDPKRNSSRYFRGHLDLNIPRASQSNKSLLPSKLLFPDLYE